MARRKVTTDEFPLPGESKLPGMEGLGELDQDPQPAATRTRTRRTTKAAPAKAAGNRGKIAARTSSGRIMTKAQMTAKVRAELYLWCSAGVAIWDDRDEECASVMFDAVNVPTPDGMVEQERLSAIVDKMVDMIARNDKTLEFLANTGLFGDAGVLLSLLVPIGKRVWKNHGPNGLGHRPAEIVEQERETLYPAYSAA